MNLGSNIGQYRIVRKLGEGGMGVVFLGEHVLLGLRAAIKTLHPTGSLCPEVVERFFNEARATSAIADPGVIQVFDFGHHVDGTAYIVMELLEGHSLATRVAQRGPLDIHDVLRIGRQVASSLAVAHRCGIVHRDLKPDNIFLVRDEEAFGGERTKVLDFGICKIEGSCDTHATQTGTMMGTPGYMSPEQCRGCGVVDHRADVYSLGCVLFHMITARDPFEAEDPGELVAAHLHEDPPAPSTYVIELPFEIDEIVLRCLAKSPKDRFQSMDEVHAAICELQLRIEDDGIGFVPDTSRSRQWRPITPRSGLAGPGVRRSPPPGVTASALPTTVQLRAPHIEPAFEETSTRRVDDAYDDGYTRIPPYSAVAVSLGTGSVAGLVVAALLVVLLASEHGPLHDRSSTTHLPGGFPTVAVALHPVPDVEPATPATSIPAITSDAALTPVAPVMQPPPPATRDVTIAAPMELDEPAAKLPEPRRGHQRSKPRQPAATRPKPATRPQSAPRPIVEPFDEIEELYGAR